MKKLSSPKMAIIYGLIILLFSLLAYINSFRNVNFLIDDWDSIVNNVKLSQPNYLFSEFFPKLDPSAGSQHYYRPLISVVIAISYWICGFNVCGYHMINWIFLYFACLSVYVLIERYFQNSFLAFMTALFYAIHPFNSYIVNNASAGFCALQLAFLCWSAIFFKSFNDQPKHYIYLFASISLYVLALLFHDNALTFPLFLLALNFIFIRNSQWTQLLWRMVPYGIVSLILYLIKKHYSAAMGNILIPKEGIFFQYIASVAKLMLWYSEKFFSGADVVFIWATSPVNTHLIWWISGLFLVLFLCLKIYFSQKRDSVFRFAAGSFFLSTVVVASACRFEPMHGWIIEPSWLAFAAISFFLALSLLLVNLRDSFPKFVFAIIFSLYTGLLLFNSWALNDLWSTEEKYCTYWAKRAPGFTTPLSYLASFYMREDDAIKAEEILRKALKQSEQPILLYKLGMIYYSAQKWDMAQQYFRKAQVLCPDSITLRLLLKDIDERKQP